VGRKRVFEQQIAAMPISDYANAFFFAHRKRVTLKRCERHRAFAVAVSKARAINLDVAIMDYLRS
jgi:hypothetical protein